MKNYLILLSCVMFSVSQIKAEDLKEVIEESVAENAVSTAEEGIESPEEDVVEETVETIEKTIEEAKKEAKKEATEEVKHEEAKEVAEDEKREVIEKKEIVEEKSTEQIRYEKEILQQQANQEILEKRANELRRTFQVDASKELTALRRIVRREYEISQDMERTSGSRFVTDRKRDRMMARMDRDLRRLRREKEVMLRSIENKVENYYGTIVDRRYKTISVLQQQEKSLAMSRLRDELRIVTNGILDEVSDKINIVPMDVRRALLQDLEARLVSSYNVKISEMGSKKEKVEFRSVPPAKPKVEEKEVVNPEEAVVEQLLKERKKKDAKEEIKEKTNEDTTEEVESKETQKIEKEETEEVKKESEEIDSQD